MAGSLLIVAAVSMYIGSSHAKTQCVSQSPVAMSENLGITNPDQCDALSSHTSLEHKVYRPSDLMYDGRVESIYSASAALEPWCFVQPSTAEDVSLVIRTLVGNECPFGIRAGGHGIFPQANSVEEGVTIDFGKTIGEFFSLSVHFKNSRLLCTCDR